jgi:glycosyltransferase involved in cell wall biosynthesis
MAPDKLRLCFVTREYALYPPFGGIATYVRTAAQWLAGQGHDIQVVCISRKHTPQIARDGSVTIHFVGPRRIRPRRLLRFASRVPRLHGLLEAYCGWDLVENSLGAWLTVERLSRPARFDVIECDDYQGLAFWGLWPLHRQRILLRGHGILHLGLPFTAYPGARFHHALEAFCADRADYILTAAQYLADAYRTELGLRHNRIASLPLPFDMSSLPQTETRRHAVDGQATILYVGRFEYCKGTDLLFAALEQVREQFPGIKCVLVGAPAPEFVERLDTFIKSNAGWVTHTGPLPQDQVFQHMARADFLVLPSRTETLPRTLIEAQSLGLPQIATRVGGIPEIVEDRVTGLLIDSGDVLALSHAVLEVCRDVDLRARMGAASRARALVTFDLAKIMTQQLTLYHVVASDKTP